MKWIGLLILMTTNLCGDEMIAVRKSDDRGSSDLGWLSTQYTFSFSNYYDPNFMGFKTLRVINEDVIHPSKGFDMHSHSDMEILTYILDGTLEHIDTIGNHSKIAKGEFQLMEAGTGIKHSEFNPSKEKQVHLLQIWIKPEKKGLTPSYQQKSFDDHVSGLKLVVSQDGSEDSLKIHQDAKIYLGRFLAQEKAEMNFAKDRHVWIQVVKGGIHANGHKLSRGDGVAISDVNRLKIESDDQSEFLLFDLK